MKLNEESIKKFKQLYAKNYGIELSESEATELASKFINLLKIVYL